MSGTQNDLAKALDELEQTISNRRKPTRFHARAVLVPLGELLLAGDPAAGPAAERCARVTAADTAGWRRAVHDEMVLACTEHLQSVDPRWLDHPKYDFAYTVAARADLEARLRACERLDLDPAEELLDRVAKADALLEPYLRSRRGEQGSN